MMKSEPVVIGILAVQGDVVDHCRIVEDAGARSVPIRRASELDQVDGLILPGGESTTIMKLLRNFEMVEPLKARIAEGMAVYGSCAGMILLAQEVLDGAPGQETLGGLEVTVRRNAFGRQVASFEADVDVTGVSGAPVRAVFIRAPWVETHSDAVEVLAEVALPGTGSAVVAVRQGNLLATSFHPEMTDDPRVHQLFIEMVKTMPDRMRGK